MTKTDSSSALRAFATLRFEGNHLDIPALSKLMEVAPTLAYGKGEPYRLGKRGIEKVGETGHWMLNTKDHVRTSELGDHIDFLMEALAHDKAKADRTFDRLKAAVGTAGLSTLVTLFWFGEASAQPPVVDPRLKTLIRDLGGEIETDFVVRGRDPGRPKGEAA